MVLQAESTSIRRHPIGVTKKANAARPAARAAAELGALRRPAEGSGYKTAHQQIGVWRSLVAHLVRDEGSQVQILHSDHDLAENKIPPATPCATLCTVSVLRGDGLAVCWTVRPNVRHRLARALRAVRGIQSRNLEIEERSTEVAVSEAVKKAAITKERVLLECARLAFSDIRKAVDWHGHVTEETDNPDGGDVLVIKKIVTNQLGRAWQTTGPASNCVFHSPVIAKAFSFQVERAGGSLSTMVMRTQDSLESK
jgi:hypothetical protein